MSSDCPRCDKLQDITLSTMAAAEKCYATLMRRELYLQDLLRRISSPEKKAFYRGLYEATVRAREDFVELIEKYMDTMDEMPNDK